MLNNLPREDVDASAKTECITVGIFWDEGFAGVFSSTGTGFEYAFTETEYLVDTDVVPVVTNYAVVTFFDFSLGGEDFEEVFNGNIVNHLTALETGSGNTCSEVGEKSVEVIKIFDFGKFIVGVFAIELSACGYI